MNILIPLNRSSMPLWMAHSWFTRWFMATAFAVLGMAFPAFASLGGTLDSVSFDQSQMKATTRLNETGSYSVYEMQSPAGTIVREYVSPAGRVFGVAWQGPFIPDLRLLLGSYFEQYSEAARTQRESHIGRRPLKIEEPGLVVQTAGHMRAYWGRAYDPALLPTGLGANEIR